METTVTKEIRFRKVKRIPATLEIGEHSGFGKGRGTDVEGWIGRAAAFAERVRREGGK